MLSTPGYKYVIPIPSLPGNRPWYHWWDKCLNVNGDYLKILMLTTCYPCTMYTTKFRIKFLLSECLLHYLFNFFL